MSDTNPNTSATGISKLLLTEAEIKKNLKQAYASFKEKKYAEAVSIYEQFLEHCDASDLTTLADIYSEKREGIKQDLAKSHACYLKAAEKGNVYSKVKVAINILKGIGIDKNIQKGMDMLIKAATENDSDWAQFQVGFTYYYGNESIKKDYAQSLHWFQLAAQKNDKFSLYHLGLQYEFGYGVEKDVHAAYDYYSKALRYGYEQAKEKINQIEKELWPKFTFALLNCDKDIVTLTDRITSARTLKISLLISGPKGSGKKAYAEYLASRLSLNAETRDVLDFVGPLKEVIGNIQFAFRRATEQRQILIFEKIDHLLSDKTGNVRDNRAVIAELKSNLKNFPFPFIYLLEDESELSPDIRDDFMICIQFNYLNRKQNQEAFRLFFMRDAPRELSSIGALTPQDYKQVKQNLFAIGEENNDAELINGLRIISQKKTNSIIQYEGTNNFDPELVNADINIRDLTERLKHQEGDPSFSMLLYGAPGAGKSEYLRYLAEQLGIEIIVKRASDVLSKWIGESEKNIAQAFKEAAVRKAFLVFDEADGLLAQRGSGDLQPLQNRQVNEMLTWMETYKYPFACTTNLIDNIDRAALRRFVFKIQFNFLSKEQIKKAFKVFFNREAPERLDIIGGLMPSDFAVVKKKAKIFGELFDDNRLIELLTEEAKKKSRSAISYIQKDSVSFNPKLINPDTDLGEIEQRLLLPDAKKNFSFLFYGPPGTGKSNYLRYLAAQMGIEFIQKRASDLLNKWLGESEKAIAEAFNEAEERKAFLVFDEADSLLASRKNASHSWQISQVNEMLTWMERHSYPFACTTNLLSQIDEAAMRRFTFKVKFDFLNQEQVVEAFRAFLNMGVPNDFIGVKILTPAIFASVQKKMELFGMVGDNDKAISLIKDELKISGYREPEKISDIVLEIPAIQLSTTPLSEGTSALQAAVVTIKFDDGHGSGYFIAKDGYLLTNYHVVRDNKFVTVKLTTGRHLPGEVLRTNAERDIALVKVNETNMAALPLLLNSPEIGTEVYAVGTPIDEKYSTTITKGIISAYRSEDNLTYIQSDVSTQPGSSGGPIVDKFGNVISTHVQGRRDASGQKIGVNYSIPIADALKFLAIQLAEKAN